MPEQPLLTVLSLSWGRQSTCLLWLVIKGHIPKPDNFVCITADPGMENSQTYRYAKKVSEAAKDAGIELVQAEGPNLLEDLLLSKHDGKKRLDNPPFWTRDENGQRGRLTQACTKHYKIAPMDRVVRRLLEERHGISAKSKRLPRGCVEKWIGFAAEETRRMSSPSAKYVRFRYPLIEMGWYSQQVIEFYLENSLPIPPRSVCNACFANGLRTLKEMHDDRPSDWKQAVAVDEAIRDSSHLGIKEECFVSHTLVPLTVLAEKNFVLDDEVDQEKNLCDTGVCFL